MSETQPHATSNGHEIEHPTEKIDFEGFKNLVEAYGLGGASPQERLEALKKQSKENLALFMADLNKRLQGSDETLISDEVVKVGDKDTIAPEHRYDLFSNIFDKIVQSRADINPARVGDTLALATVLLHPFKDGNGRTARMFGLLYREDYDDPNSAQTFEALAEPRDEARKRGGFVIYGYTPRIGEGADRSDPRQVEAYIDRLLQSNEEGLYVGPGGNPQLIDPALSNTNGKN